MRAGKRCPSPIALHPSRFTDRRHAPLRHHDFPERLPVVRGSVAAGQAHPAVVRRQRLGLDHEHAVLPDAAARRLWLCPRGRGPAWVAGAATAASRAGGCVAAVAGPAVGVVGQPVAGRCQLEARRQPFTGQAHSAVADGQHRSAVPGAVGHQPAGAGLVQPPPSRRIAVPAVCAVQRRFAGRVAGLSVCDRAAGGAETAGDQLGDRLRVVCDRHLAVRARGSAGRRAKEEQGRSRSPRTGAGSPATWHSTTNFWLCGSPATSRMW